MNIILLVLCFFIPRQENVEKLFLEARELLNKGDTLSAELKLQECIGLEDYAPAYYELAVIENGKNTIKSRASAKNYIEKAIRLDKKNTLYRLFHAGLMKIYAPVSAQGYYREIVEMDKTCSPAWFELGRYKEKEFLEYYISLKKSGADGAARGEPPYRDLKETFLIPMDMSAKKYFDECIEFYKNTVEYDPKYTPAYLGAAFMHLEVKKYYSAKKLIDKILEYDADNFQALLLQGIIYDKMALPGKAWESFNKAINLAPPDVRVDYLSNSLIMLAGTEDETEVQKYFNASDPVMLTDYNERLLEHYIRMTYANFHFGKERFNPGGWRTHMGMTVVRYGIPVHRMRFRPFHSAKDFYAKTDIWNYRELTVAFADYYMSGNYQYCSTDFGSVRDQYGGDSHSFMENMKRNKPEIYRPSYKTGEFEGIRFYEFYNPQEKENVVAAAYGLIINNEDIVEKKYVRPFDYGIFLRDTLYQSVERKKGLVKSLSIHKEFPFSVLGIAEHKAGPGTYNALLELKMVDDGTVYSHNEDLTVKDHSGLSLSSVLLAKNVEQGIDKKDCIKRGDISILPDPLQSFKPDFPFFIYFEIYNLETNNNLTDFTQTVEIRKKESGSLISGLLKFTGLKKEENGVVLSSDYKTFEADPKIYFQVDMKEYDPGEYIVTVNITDKISGNIVAEDTQFRLIK